MNQIAQELRRIADIAEAGDKPHWAKVMRAGAAEIETLTRERPRGDSDGGIAAGTNRTTSGSIGQP